MKKVALITCGLQDNFGAVLQATATEQALDKIGCNTELVNYNFEDSKSYLPYKQKTFKSFVASILFFSLRKSMNISFASFRKKWLKITPEVMKNTDDLDHLLDRFDVALVGSDQVWNPLSNFDKRFSLVDVDNNIKRVSYASSFGVKEIPDEYKELFNKTLKRFQYLSVREESGKIIIKDLIGKEASINTDPVFLLTKEEWLKYEEPVRNLADNNFVFVYDMWHAPEMRNYAKKVSDELGCKAVILSRNDFHDKEMYQLYGMNPGNFIWLIKNAKYIVTDSFHGTAFSIIFRKNFNSYCSNSGSLLADRIKYLLSSLGLGDRLLTNKNDKPSKVCYEKAEVKLDNWIKSSWEYLKKAI